MGKAYIGARHRETGEARVFVEEPRSGFIAAAGGKALAPLLHICLHSPTGLEWGYGGSGPGDCALSILADYFGEAEVLPASCVGRYNVKSVPVIEQTKAWQLHQEFKWLVVASLPHGRPEAGVALRRADILFNREAWLQAWRLDDEQVREAVGAILNKGLRCLNCMSLLGTRGSVDSSGVVSLACANSRCPVSYHKQHPFAPPADWPEDEV